ncbi:MAG: hypothetical protein PHX43_02995 [Alphaproteobacteria bacterium]|nr:hypothetical protein [Alphaproteobacteria bacterium]
MAKSYPSHFEVFGSLEHVLREAKLRLPAIFPEQAAGFMDSLCNIVTKQAELNKWDIVVLHVSKGFSRKVLDELVQNVFPHKGSISIDPAGSSPEYNTYDSPQSLKVSKERLVRLNEEMDDVMIVVYGVDQLDRPTEVSLIKRNLHLVGMLLDYISNEDDLSQDESEELELIRQRERKLKQAKERLNQLMLGLGSKSFDFDDPINVLGASAAMFMLYTTVNSLLMDPNNDGTKYMLRQLLHQLKSIPQNFAHMGFDFEPFLDASIIMHRHGPAISPALTANQPVDPHSIPGNAPNHPHAHQGPVLDPE